MVHIQNDSISTHGTRALRVCAVETTTTTSSPSRLSSIARLLSSVLSSFHNKTDEWVVTQIYCNFQVHWKMSFGYQVPKQEQASHRECQRKVSCESSLVLSTIVRA